jgi:hypothetical protein
MPRPVIRRRSFTSLSAGATHGDARATLLRSRDRHRVAYLRSRPEASRAKLASIREGKGEAGNGIPARDILRGKADPRQGEDSERRVGSGPRRQVRLDGSDLDWREDRAARLEEEPLNRPSCVDPVRTRIDA